MKLCEEKYEKPFFPPVLQWFPVYRGEMRAGEVLAAFEMLQVSVSLDICVIFSKNCWIFVLF